jgi:hypothetical protein
LGPPAATSRFAVVSFERSLSATFLPTDVCEQGPLMDSPYGSGRTVIGPSPPSTNAIASRSPDRLRIRRCGAGDVTATEPANAW